MKTKKNKSNKLTYILLGALIMIILYTILSPIFESSDNWECIEYKTVEKMEIRNEVTRYEPKCGCSGDNCFIEDRNWFGCMVTEYVDKPFIHKWNEEVCVKEHFAYKW